MTGVQTCALPIYPAESFCSACFTGRYPVPVPDVDTKFILEAGSTTAPADGSPMIVGDELVLP